VFADAFAQAVSKVEAFQNNAADSVNKFLSGEGEELHKVALDSQQAQLSFDLFLQVRNKVVAAYQEVMRMQV
jgi:flagellar hook-basal body complex protein FliE